jgi:hypothetical protein
MFTKSEISPKKVIYDTKHIIDHKEIVQKKLNSNLKMLQREKLKNEKDIEQIN